MNQLNFKVKINTYFKSISNRKIPKLVSTFFFTLLFGLGFDFGFIELVNRNYRSYLKALSTIVSILLFLALFTPLFYVNEFLTQVFYGAGCLHYTVHVLVLYISKYNVYHFITDVYKIHNKTYDKENIFLSCAVVYYLFAFLLKITVCITHCAVKEDDCFTITSIPLSPYCVPIMALDVVSFAQVLIYYYVHASLNFLKQLMEKKCIELSNAREQFTMIADCCDKINAFYGKMVSFVCG